MIRFSDWGKHGSWRNSLLLQMMLGFLEPRSGSIAYRRRPVPQWLADPKLKRE
ncbi:MAG: hypothetical protein IIU34_00630 [Bacteroidales bacterium]|nr:hypothetical protein [Bacteroidales bacterium]